MIKKDVKIAIVGGGVAGASAAYHLSSLGFDTTIFEQNDTLVSGPPFCHLHAGGNLYREISDQQCITLLHQSIDLLKLYPIAIDFRPTVIVTPLSDDEDPKDLMPRLDKLQKEYENSINKDPSNKVLGDPKNYYKFYDKDEVLKLCKNDIVNKPSTLDEWVTTAVKNIELEKIKFPIVIVQEYGLNIFRLSAALNIKLQTIKKCNLMLNTKVTNIKKKIQNKQEKYSVTYKKDEQTYFQEFDFLINAAGFKTGIFDDMLGFKRERFVEFKAAYVTKWQNDILWPEVIFHGKRGTPQGMGQFTPYPGGYFQLHGMTNYITLFDKGLVKSCCNSSQPKLSSKFENKIYKNWSQDIVEQRTKNAIDHLAKYIPSFKTATVASKPLYGAQQIPGNDKDLRAADVSFEKDTYARCEVVKASSVLDMCDEIVKKLVKLNFTSKDNLFKRFYLTNISSEDILKEAQEICKKRDYPTSLGDINISALN